jgi:hypothetical protein
MYQSEIYSHTKGSTTIHNFFLLFRFAVLPQVYFIRKLEFHSRLYLLHSIDESILD